MVLLKMLLMLGFMPFSLVAGEPSVGDLHEQQQSMLLLKAELERERLKAELKTLTTPTVLSADMCMADGIGLLSLRIIYGVEGRRVAQFSYGPNVLLEGREGEVLACGEKILEILDQEVRVEHNGKCYSVTVRPGQAKTAT